MIELVEPLALFTGLTIYWYLFVKDQWKSVE